MHWDTDVFIVGGGPAGLVAGVAAARRGFSVTLADAAAPPIGKACGEGLMPDALAAAAKLGIQLPADLGYPFRGIRFASPSHTVSAHFPHDVGRGVPRTLLHPLLTAAAEKEGVSLLWKAPVSGIDGHTVQLASGTALRARWIIGADGSQSRTRHWAGLTEVRRATRRFGFRRHYRREPWSEYMEIHWGERCQFYITPVASDAVCVVLMSRAPALRIDEALHGFPRLRERLHTAEVSLPERGAAAGTCRLQRVTRGPFALVGDASGTVDAITGDGLCLSFLEAVALADALDQDDLSHYETAHAQLTRRPVLMAEFMLLLDRSAWLRRQALQALASRPDLFANLLATHVGSLNFRQFAATATSLAWAIAAA